MATVLLQPQSFQPETILVDEPELGLHPYAITVLAPFVRQTMDIDFDEFIEPLVSPIRKSYTFTEGDKCQSQVEVVDKKILLETIEVVPEVELEKVVDIAHRENVSDWTRAISLRHSFANANYFFSSSVQFAS